MVTPYEKDPENAFLRRGFLPQVGENFELITVVTGDMGPKETYGALLGCHGFHMLIMEILS